MKEIMQKQDIGLEWNYFKNYGKFFDSRKQD